MAKESLKPSSKIARLQSEKKTLKASIEGFDKLEGHDETKAAYKKRIAEIDEQIKALENPSTPEQPKK